MASGLRLQAAGAELRSAWRGSPGTLLTRVDDLSLTEGLCCRRCSERALGIGLAPEFLGPHTSPRIPVSSGGKGPAGSPNILSPSSLHCPCLLPPRVRACQGGHEGASSIHPQKAAVLWVRLLTNPTVAPPQSSRNAVSSRVFSTDPSGLCTVDSTSLWILFLTQVFPQEARQANITFSNVFYNSKEAISLGKDREVR